MNGATDLGSRSAPPGAEAAPAQPPAPGEHGGRHRRPAAAGDRSDSGGGGLRRFRLVAGLELAEAARRPMFWLWAALMGGNAWLMSRGIWIYRSVDTSLGSPRAWADSEFQVAFVLPLLSFLMVSFFVAVAAGLPVLRDNERKVGALLAATPLSAGEYIWGKFAGVLGACLAAVATLLGFLLLFMYALPDAATPEIYGPFTLAATLRPLVLLMLPGLIFLAGAAFLLGQATGKPIVVFLLPVALVPFLQSFVWAWFPADLSPAAAAALRYLDPSGFRWLKETWLRVDRGIAFYNTHPIAYDLPFVASRIAFVAAGLLLVDVARRHFSRQGADRARRRGPLARGSSLAHGAPPAVLATLVEVPMPLLAPARDLSGAVDATLAGLAMRSRPTGVLRGIAAVARFELAELVAQPGLYIFLPAVLLFLGIDFASTHPPIDTRTLLTPGTAAVGALAVLAPWICLLLLFSTVESLQRERSTRLAPILYATPVPTAAILAGKALAEGAMVAACLAASFLLCAWIMLAQGQVHIQLWPFVLVWGLLLTPTLLAFTAFVIAVFAVTDSRYLTYGIGLTVLIATFAAYLYGHLNWVCNWLLIDALRWSDMGTFELDRRALWLNRLEVLALVPPLALAAERWFRRREADRLAGSGAPPAAADTPPAAVAPSAPGDGSAQPALRSQPRSRTRPGIRPSRPLPLLAAATVPAVALGLALLVAVEQGFDGGIARRRHKDYWRQNVATWMDAPLPYVTHVDLDLEMEPARRWFRVRGAYDLTNRKAAPIPWFPVTGGIAWKHLSWTLDGRPYQPYQRDPADPTGMFEVRQPIAPGATRRLGFQYEATFLPGVSRAGGALPLGEFMLPSGVLVTGRNPDFVPILGFKKDVGIDDDNRFEPRRYPPDFWRSDLDASLDRSAFTSRLRITAPAEYTVNSTGILTGQTLHDGRRTWQWDSDYPLRVFNVAAGRWAVARGQGTAVYYHPGHPWNVPSLLEALDGARRYYAAWFGPYPWRDLRLNEFPAVADYARGNATNIFFSESVGFTEVPGTFPDAAFEIAAHEAAHQWWGHIMSPGEGPGGIILAEGAANFSTMMLLEQVRGTAARIAFATRSEAVYGESRAPSTELPLAQTTPFRPADDTVIYDRGGWALWMLLQHMGRDRFLAGARQFIAYYHAAPGHPVIQHFLATMRPYAANPQAFDDLTGQLFFQVVVPEYRIVEVHKQRLPGAAAWQVVARIANAGNARFAVAVAAANQPDRFSDKGQPVPTYRDARATLTLAPGEEREVRILCPFDPHRLVVDPDANVLQLQRKAASARL